MFEILNNVLCDKNKSTTLTWLCLIAMWIPINISSSYGDTYIHRKDKTTYHGYSIRSDSYNKTIVQTIEKGSIELNLSEYIINYDYKGRNPYISLLIISKHL